MRTIEPLGLQRVLVSGQKVLGEPVDAWSSRLGHETGFSGRICRHRIGREIVVERDVLLENNHQMFNGIGRFRTVLTVLCSLLPAGDAAKGRGSRDCRQTNGLNSCHFSTVSACPVVEPDNLAFHSVG